MEDVTHVKPSWDDYFMAIARIVATRASCDRLHAGAVLVKNNRIVSTGYNGAPAGLEHCDDVGHLMEEGHCVRTIHGEHNAVLQAAIIGGSSTKGTTMYSLYSPCIHCAKYIVASGVERIVVGKVYRNQHVIDYFASAGVAVTVYKHNTEWDGYVSELFLGEIREREGKEVTLENTHKETE